MNVNVIVKHEQSLRHHQLIFYSTHILLSFLLIHLRIRFLYYVHQHYCQRYLRRQIQQHDVLVRRLTVVLYKPNRLQSQCYYISSYYPLKTEKLNLCYELRIQQEGDQEGLQQLYHHDKYFLHNVPTQSIN